MNDWQFWALFIGLLLYSGVQVEKWAAKAYHGKYYNPFYVWLVVVGVWTIFFAGWLLVRRVDAAVAPPGVDTVDLSVRFAQAPAVVRSGQTASYEVQIANSGPSAAREPVLVIVMPVEVRPVLPVLGSTGWDCVIANAGRAVRVVCTDILMAPGTFSVGISFQVLNVPPGGVVRARAMVGSSTADVNWSNDVIEHVSQVYP